MKKQLLTLIILSGIVGAVSAQPTLTATGINPVAGDQFPTTMTNYVDPGTAGANQTWDLSSATTANTAANSCVSTATTPNGASFPTSNVCMVSNPNYSYYTTSASAWQNAGFYTSNTAIVYSNKEDLLRFPFAYTNSYTDYFASTFLYYGYNFLRTGSVTVTADGYGTLILPNGTYNNVMRVHFVENYQDSTDMGGSPYIVTYQNDEYMWYLNGNHTPIAAVSQFTSSGSLPSSYGFYLNNIIGINENAHNSNLVDAFPSPANNEITLKVKGIKDIETIDISNVSGVQVKSIPALSSNEDAYLLNVSDLANGVYFIQLKNAEGIKATKKIVIAR